MSTKSQPDHIMSANVMSATPGPDHIMPAKPESAHVMSAHVMSAKPGPSRKMSASPESRHKMAAIPDSSAKMAATPEPRHVTAVTKVSPKDFFWEGYNTQAPADAELGPGLIASVMDPLLMSVRAAGIPRASALAVTETVPLTSVLPVMAVAILSVWAAHCTLEASPVHESAPEASPVRESAPKASPNHETTPVPPEVAASAAEPPEESASTAEPPEVAAFAAEPPEVVVPTFALNVCHVTATEAVHELTACPVTATEAAHELPALPAPPWLPALSVLPLLQARLCSTLQVLFPFTGLALHPAPWTPSVLPPLHHPPGLFFIYFFYVWLGRLEPPLEGGTCNVGFVFCVLFFFSCPFILKFSYGSCLCHASLSLLSPCYWFLCSMCHILIGCISRVLFPIGLFVHVMWPSLFVVSSHVVALFLAVYWSFNLLSVSLVCLFVHAKSFHVKSSFGLRFDVWITLLK